ncbi:MAG TPA: hypothetical protein VGD51_08705 [Nocardioidaceae bacterium]
MSKNKTKVKQSQVRRALAERLAGEDEEIDLTPIRISTKDAAEVEMEPLFYIDDQEYQIPKRLPASLSLRYLRVLREEGQEAAAGEVLERVLGDEAYTALMECDEVDGKQLKRIMRIVEHKALGQLEDESGN